MSGVKATSSCRIPEHRVLREQPATAGVTRHHLQKSTLVIENFEGTMKLSETVEPNREQSIEHDPVT